VGARYLVLHASRQRTKEWHHEDWVVLHFPTSKDVQKAFLEKVYNMSVSAPGSGDPDSRTRVTDYILVETERNPGPF